MILSLVDLIVENDDQCDSLMLVYEGREVGVRLRSEDGELFVDLVGEPDEEEEGELGDFVIATFRVELRATEV